MTEKLIFRGIFVALVAGTLYRLFPIVAGQPALSHFFMTEDGYLMLTVARNLAQGLGMSVSEGTIPTNGVQPLATFLFALPYLATGGNKVTSLIGIHLILAGVALAGAFAVRAFAARVLTRQDGNPAWPWLVAALWYLGPHLVTHTMNGLETGLYTLVLLLTLLQFDHLLAKGEEARVADRMVLGALCGLTFLARNDGVFLVVAIFGLWGLRDLLGARRGLGTVLARTVPPGLLSLLIAAPWLINNKLKFGAFVPISGQSESLTAAFGQNLHLLPAKLFEAAFPMIPMPGRIETLAPTIAVTALVVLGLVGVFLAGAMRRGGSIGLVVAAYAIYGCLLAAYYGLFFGAAYFLGRYLAPLAPLLITAALSVLLDLLRRVRPAAVGVIGGRAGLAGLVLSGALLARLLLPGQNVQGHFQEVRWVADNLPATTWVGAIQTGTLGYWHDRTINLDGKVNPDALAARRKDGNVLHYVVASNIDYLVDWVGIADWVDMKDDDFNRRFEVLVDDPSANLAVLRRRG